MSTPRRQAPAIPLRRHFGNLSSLLAQGTASRPDEHTVELYLNPAEAEQGGMIPISMTVTVAGPREELFSAWLAVPPGVEDGTVLQPSATLDGMQPITFRVKRAA